MRYPQMRLETLRLFCDAVELRSFSAAGNLHQISEADTLRQIQEIEQQYGTEFFERGMKRLTLTEKGLIFEKAARGILAIAESLPTLLG